MSKFLSNLFLIALATTLPIGSSHADDLPFDGYNLFSPIGSTTTYLMDNDGSMVHSWESDYRPGQSVYLMEDGTLMRSANTQGPTLNAGGTGGAIEQFDWNGDRLWSYEYRGSDYRPHHDVEVLPNGNVLMIAWEIKTEAEAIAAGRDPSLLVDGELWPDHIIEVEPTGVEGGNIVWQWHVWDHLIQEYDGTKDNYGVVADHPELIDLNYSQNGVADWNHINSIDYNADLDQILLSVHSFNEIWVIDHSTTTEEARGHSGGASGMGGDLLYRWGNPSAYGAGTSADRRLYRQHDAEWIETGLPGASNILIFNNGQGRPGGNYSSVDEIVPPVNPDASYTLTPGSAYGPSEAVWTYEATPTSDFYAPNISGSQRLPNGNTLICQGPDGRFFEVTSDGEIVWESNHGSAVFRVDRYSPTYPGFGGTPLNEGEEEHSTTLTFPIVDTGQDVFYDNASEISAPAPGQAFHGQDAQYTRNAPSFTSSGEGLTVLDHVTGLTWTKSPDWDDDGDIDIDDKFTFTEFQDYPATLNAANYGGHDDWRTPTIKDLYSLMDFRGQDISSFRGTDPSGIRPFLDTDYFDVGYGDLDAGERLIDGQLWSSTEYVSTTMNGQATVFGLNIPDGRIKGYGRDFGPGGIPTHYGLFVRGNTSYGQNDFIDNGDGTVTDRATGLMWQQGDSGIGYNWQEALAYAEGLSLAGKEDWRLPNAKELQSLLDYTRSPATHGTAAIDPLFTSSSITDEGGGSDFPSYWSSTTHVNTALAPGEQAVYLSFGTGFGFMEQPSGSGNYNLLDVHGAGCQRSDPKQGDPADFPTGFGPQGDVVRIFNYVRAVRDAEVSPTEIANGWVLY